MTDAERDRLRKLQDRWLALPSIMHQAANHGWDQQISHRGSPSLAMVRDLLLPAWEGFFRASLEEPR